MSIFWPFLKRQHPEYRKTIFSDIISVKNTHTRNFDFWTKRHGLIPLKNVHYLNLFKTSIFSNFGQNPWTNPFGKCLFFLAFFKTSIFSS